MDPNKWRIKKLDTTWILIPPAGYPIQARGSWLYCVSRLNEVQRIGMIQTSSRWRDG
jgi:hypothetical protein